jgi:uncharacterized protein
MLPIVLLVLVLAVTMLLVVAPQIWIHRVMTRHAVERRDLPGTGGEVARHVLDQLQLQHVRVEATELGNHYDPTTLTVRLEPRFLNGKSLSAVVIAMHEIGHAIQHAMQLPMFERRLKVGKQAQMFNMIAAGFLFASPLLILIGKTQTAMTINVVGVAGPLLLSIATQLVTLPVEFDASFTRALPLLQQGKFIPAADMPAARQLLRAAAYTYVAGLLRTLISVPGISRPARI